MSETEALCKIVYKLGDRVASDPKILGLTVIDNHTCWTTARLELLDWLKRNAPSLAELYEGAVELLYRHPLPGWTRFVSHAVREIRNRLPDVISGSTRGPKLDYTNRLNAISVAWENAGLHKHNIPSVEEFHSPPSAENPYKPIEVPPEIYRLIGDLLVEHQKVTETNAEAAQRFFEACAPENKILRETLQPVVKNLIKVTELFMRHTHDSGVNDKVIDKYEFCRNFELFESILGSLIRAFFASLDELDEIFAASNVTQIDRAVFFARAGHYRYFFDKLDDPRWIGPLAEKGFFHHPPALIPVDGGQYVQIPQWPESRFLARIVRSASDQEQEKLVKIACEIPETENAWVNLDLAEVSLAVPPKLAVRFVPKAKKWVKGPIFDLPLPTKLGDLAVHLARGGYLNEAHSLVRQLLAILPDPQKGKGYKVSEHYIPNPCARFHPWFYGEILKRHIPELVRYANLPIFDVLCDLLSAAIRQSLREGDNNQGDNYSAIWRPAIEDHEQNTLAWDLRCMLLVAVRDAAGQIAETDHTSVRQIVERLERRNLPVFDRIALHLLRLHADSVPDLVRERLTRKELYDSYKHHHEYILLLQARFARLSPADRELILGWVEKGPDIERFAANHESGTGQHPSAEELERHADHYRLQRLWPLRDDLPENWRQRIATLVARLGVPEHPDFLRYWRSEGSTIEERSPKTIDDLRGMSLEDIADFVRNWQSPHEFHGPSHEGLQYVLMKMVADEPERFAAAIDLFLDSPPPYIKQ